MPPLTGLTGPRDCGVTAGRRLSGNTVRSDPALQRDAGATKNRPAGPARRPSFGDEHNSKAEFALASVDVEANDGINIHGLVAAKDRSEPPLGQGCYYALRDLLLCGFEHANVLEGAALVHDAGEQYAGFRDISRYVGGHRFGGS